MYNYAFTVRETINERYTRDDFWSVGVYDVLRVEGYRNGVIIGKTEYSFSEEIFGRKAKEKAEALCERLNRKANIMNA